jgi:hypothetical protein
MKEFPSGQGACGAKAGRSGEPFLFMEKVAASSIEFGLDVWRDWRDELHEATFLNNYGNNYGPLNLRFGKPYAFHRVQPDPKKLRSCRKSRRSCSASGARLR